MHRTHPTTRADRTWGVCVSLVFTILALGLMASLSPTTIIVFILVLATTRARANAAAFLIGWGCSLVVVFTASYFIGKSHYTQQGGGRVLLDVLEALLGGALVYLGNRQWRRRHEPRPVSGLTKNLTTHFEALRPWQAAAVGVLKQPWALTAAAALVVIRDHAAFLVAVIAFIVFTVVSTATVGLTYLYFARRPGEAEAHLQALRDRVVAAGPTIVAVALWLVGAYLIAQGVFGLFHD